MALKRGLGKGLDALLPQDESSDSAPEAGVTGTKAPREQMIPLDKLMANPEQPRKTFDDGELAELADSIREHGVIQPIIAEEAGDGTYIIVAGERRCRAAKIANLREIPAIIRKYSDEKRMAVSLIENIQRANLNPIEEAGAYKRLMELTRLSQDDVAARVGKNRSTVANALRLLKLPGEMQKSIREGSLSPGHARAILSVSGARNQELLFREILKKNLSVREAERKAASLSTPQKPQKKKSSAKGLTPELNAMEEKFLSRLGTKVKINGDLNGGTIVIDYYSMDDLDRLYGILGG